MADEEKSYRSTGRRRRDAIWNYFEVEYTECQHTHEVAAGGTIPEKCPKCKKLPGDESVTVSGA